MTSRFDPVDPLAPPPVAPLRTPTDTLPAADSSSSSSRLLLPPAPGQPLPPGHGRHGLGGRLQDAIPPDSDASRAPDVYLPDVESNLSE